MSITAMKQALYALEMGLTETFHARQENAIAAPRTAIAEAEEPVAWMDASETALSWENYLDCMKPLYTTPPAAQRQPLKQERIDKIIEQCQITLLNYCCREKQTEFARAVEAAHGIKERRHDSTTQGSATG